MVQREKNDSGLNLCCAFKARPSMNRVKAENNKNFEFGHFSVVEYFGQYVQFCLFFTPVFSQKWLQKFQKLISEKISKMKIFCINISHLVNPIR